MPLTVSLRTGSWCGDAMVDLPFPDHWNIQLHNMLNLPAMTDGDIAKQVDSPIDSCSLDSQLRPGQKIAIVIDDHSRPTPVSLVLPHVLKRIREKGIPNENVTIIVAVGTHTFPDTSLMAAKLGGADGQIRVVFPDCRDSSELRFIGMSSTGVPVYVNRHFADADIRIAISGVYPHDEVSFSGGAKILIGVFGLETLSRIHRRHGLLKRGSVVETKFRLELEEIGDLAQLNYSINCILNQEKRLSAVYCGDFRSAFRAATLHARNDFGTTVNPDADVVICNAYPLDTALCVLGKSKWPFAYVRPDAHKILVTALCNCPAGRVPLAVGFRERTIQKLKAATGLSRARRLCRESLLRLKANRDADFKWKQSHVIYVPYIDQRHAARPAIIENCMVEYSWQTIMGDLLRRIGNTTAVNVSVFACAPMLYPVAEER